MKTFKDYLSENYTFKILQSEDFSDLNESERIEIDNFMYLLESHIKLGEEITEGLLAKIVGGIGGVFLGPMIGKVIARTLGIEKGVLYNILTSKLVNAALGAAITDYITTGKV